MTEQMCRRAVFTAWVVTAALVLAMPVLAHPGHEYKVTGTISKIRGPHFEVADSKGAETAFMIVPATEIFVGDAKGVATDIKTGARAYVEGVENEKGITEARIVKLSRF